MMTGREHLPSRSARTIDRPSFPGSMTSTIARLGARFACEREPFVSRPRPGDDVPLLLESLADETSDLLVVLDEHHVHRAP